MDLSFSEILIILLAIIVLFGPKKLPEIARELGKGIRKMRNAIDDVKDEVMKDSENPINNINDEIQEAKKTLENSIPSDPLEGIKPDVSNGPKPTIKKEKNDE